MSKPSVRESYAAKSLKSESLLLEGLIFNDSATVSIRQLPASIPIETGTTEAVGIGGTGFE